MQSSLADTAAPALRSKRSNRRSRLVCLACHQKKVKCDIQKNPTGPCSKCVEAGTAAECRVRPSRRLKSNHRAEPYDNNSDLHSTVPLLTGLDQSPPYDEVASPLQITTNPSLSLLADVAEQWTGTQRRAAHSQSFSAVPPRTLPISHTGLNSEPSPSQHVAGGGPSPSSSLQGGTRVASYLGDSGYMQIFSGNGAVEAGAPAGPQNISQIPPPALQESYLETYRKYCYTWCPVLDRTEDGSITATQESPILQYALALIGSHMEPPVLPHAEPTIYYKSAKDEFYNNQERNPLLAISAIMLFYWWGPGPPDVMSIDSAWWWTGVAIRQSQQLGLHREPRAGQTLLPGETPELRRRIWWTLFARERLTSICMGRPCMIDPDDCNIKELTIADFSTSCRNRAETFIYWVRLCAIIGRVSKFLLRRTDATPFPMHLAQQLKEWVESLPPRLQLPIQTQRTINFDPDIHQLHLPYLTTVTLLYLSRTPRSLPRAYKAAILASCCVARIFEDFTARGSLRFLQGMAGWSIAIAIVALLHARKDARLTVAADADIHVLRVALREIARTWHSSRMFERGFQRLDQDASQTAPTQGAAENAASFGLIEEQNPLSGPESPCDILEWRDFFPYLTPETRPLAAIVLAPTPAIQFADLDWPEDMNLELSGFFDPRIDPNFSMFAF